MCNINYIFKYTYLYVYMCDEIVKRERQKLISISKI